MTMYTLPNFCRVCLKYDKNLIDLEHIENEPSETLMSKLQHCVSEVEWKVFKPLLCHPCIKRLNIAYTFKKQCVQSATMLKSYIALVTKNKTEAEQIPATDVAQSNAYMMLPNQKYIKIVVGPQSQNTSYQNVFLNVVPTPVGGPLSPETKNSKDTNQNVFLNINSTFQKYVPTETPKTVNQLLTESKSEELSVEIDPLDLGLGDEGASEEEQDGENGVNDWEDVISAMKIASKSNGATNGKDGAKSSYGNFVPILPKQPEDKMDFSNSGEHFLSQKSYSLLDPIDYSCETCQKDFGSRITLKSHIKNFHMGKFPYKCDYCGNELLSRTEYDACMKYHKRETDHVDTSLTLNDFKNESPSSEKIVTESEEGESADLVCDICHRQFNSHSGLLRHKVRKHNQKSKKKYFIKGMKNAKCDICNREFSTQSYMQLHRKLHMRDDIGYKYKVFGKNRYVKSEEGTSKTEKKEGAESDDDKAPKTDNQDDKKSNNDEMEVDSKEESDNGSEH